MAAERANDWHQLSAGLMQGLVIFTVRLVASQPGNNSPHGFPDNLYNTGYQAVLL